MKAVSRERRCSSNNTRLVSCPYSENFKNVLRIDLTYIFEARQVLEKNCHQLSWRDL